MSQKKLNSKIKSAPLRRSASTTSLGLLFSQHINLRDTKSYTGGMEDTKSISSDENEVTNDKNAELTTQTKMYSEMKDEVETRDKSTNEIVVVKTEILQQGGRTYSLNDLAYLWKKDCRIWLWKNCPELKHNRSVGDKIKSGLIKLRDFKY